MKCVKSFKVPFCLNNNYMLKFWTLSLYVFFFLFNYFFNYTLHTLNNFSPFIGTTAGESVADMCVNSSAKLLTSSSWRIFGTKGAGIFFAAKSFQLIPW